MKLYSYLSGIWLLKNYTAKFMFIALLGLHIPLFGIGGLLVFTSGSAIDKLLIFLLTLGLTLVATVITLMVLNALVFPLIKAQQCLSGYLSNTNTPNLPENYTDEMGILMRDINTVVASPQNSRAEKEKVIKVLSHDLRAPATNVLALIMLMREEKDPDEMDKYLNNITDSVIRQLKLMDDMVYNYDLK